MHKIKRKKLINLNNNYNIPYLPINIINQNIYEELKKLNYNLEKLQKILENNNPIEKNYLKKEGTYHML